MNNKKIWLIVLVAVIIIAVVLVGSALIGKPLFAPSGSWCNDTDKTAQYPTGNNIYVEGTATWGYGGRTYPSSIDYCADSTTIKEYYCSGSIGMTTLRCPSNYICKDGACKQAHLACVGNVCTLVQGAGSNTCSPVGSACCSDDCTSGQKVCSGTYQWKQCGNYDNDTCLDWSSSFNCASGTVCQNGICVNETHLVCASTNVCISIQGAGTNTCSPVGSACQSCTNECFPSGAKQCSGTYQWKQCGNYDNDTCLDWSSLSTCASGKYCTNGTCVNSCYDSDYGQNILVKGYGQWQGGAAQWDACVSNSTVKEYYCTTAALNSVNISCTGNATTICNNGRCQ